MELNACVSCALLYREIRDPRPLDGRLQLAATLWCCYLRCPLPEHTAVLLASHDHAITTQVHNVVIIGQIDEVAVID